jgi:hypothetical protein
MLFLVFKLHVQTRYFCHSCIYIHLSHETDRAKADPNNILKFSPFLKQKQGFSITKTKWLMLFNKVITVYTENNKQTP